jgi:hypothetical protein
MASLAAVKNHSYLVLLAFNNGKLKLCIYLNYILQGALLRSSAYLVLRVQRSRLLCCGKAYTV